MNESTMMLRAILVPMSKLDNEILRISQDGKIDCAQAFLIARKLSITPKEVGVAIDELGIKIHNCQLGCFK